MDESSSQASVKARLDAAEEKHRAASDAILDVKNGDRDFRACMNALVAAQDELDELKREYEPYEQQDVENRFTADSTVPNLLNYVKLLRDELRSVDQKRIINVRDDAADSAIDYLWKMMHRHGGNPPPPQPLWASDRRYIGRVMAARQGLPAPPIPESPEVHAALDAVEQWCRQVNEPVSPDSRLFEILEPQEWKVVSYMWKRGVLTIDQLAGGCWDNKPAPKTIQNTISRINDKLAGEEAYSSTTKISTGGGKYLLIRPGKDA